jgi:plasmid maintenance system antidote protein VapI
MDITISPIYPGEVLLEDFMKLLGLTSIAWRMIMALRPFASVRS